MQVFVPLAVRLCLLQFANFLVCVKLFPAHTVPVAGDQAVARQLGRQDLVPLMVLLRELQSARVRVWVRL